jgi:cytochrome o ubiquinol oxidase subunit 1
MTLILLSMDRMLGMHFFTSTFGGNPMMYINLVWSWGHPEVYILMIPAFGIYSEIVSVFSQKKLFGYGSLVGGAIGITLLSMLVWLHHFFTMGAGSDVNAFFGIMTGVIAIPTGVQVFNWLATMFRGRIILNSIMYWFIGFVVTFTMGGVAGVLLGIPGVDYEVHNTLFLVAHFHTMVIGGALFGIFAGITYWWPKVTGFKLNDKLGKYAFWLWLVGFLASFMPLYILGFMGATRRMDHYDASTGFQPLFIVAGIGFLIIACGALMQIWQIISSIMHRKENLDPTGDPWNGRTLEWATSSPPPEYNFAIIPTVTSRDAFWERKSSKSVNQFVSESVAPQYEDIHMPKNTAIGIYISGFALAMGFALVWQIIWLVVLGLVGIIVCVIVRALDEETEYTISAEEVAKIEAERSSHG